MFFGDSDQFALVLDEYGFVVLHCCVYDRLPAHPCSDSTLILLETYENKPVMLSLLDVLDFQPLQENEHVSLATVHLWHALLHYTEEIIQMVEGIGKIV